MKNLLLLILLFFILSACEKDEPFASENEKIEGFWLLTDITGGFSGLGYDASFDHLQINEGQRYSLMVHDSFIQEGTYEWREEDDQLNILFTPSVVDTIAFDDDIKKVIFNEEENILTLMDPCCDLFVYTFFKEE